MSLEELKADLAANSAAIAALDPVTTTTHDLVNLIKSTLWPFHENVVNELAEIDGAVQDVVDGIDDILHEETGAIFAGVIVGAAVLIGELKKRLALPADAKLVKAIKEWEAAANEAKATLAEIVVADPDEDDAAETEDEDDAEDEIDDEDAETEDKE